MECELNENRTDRDLCRYSIEAGLRRLLACGDIAEWSELKVNSVYWRFGILYLYYILQ